jgi:hypothetical protein
LKGFTIILVSFTIASARGRFNLCLKARGILYPLTPAQSNQSLIEKLRFIWIAPALTFSRISQDARMRKGASDSTFNAIDIKGKMASTMKKVD